MEAAIAVLRHSADEKTVREKMKMTFIYRQAMVNDEAKSSDVWTHQDWYDILIHRITKISNVALGITHRSCVLHCR